MANELVKIIEENFGVSFVIGVILVAGLIQVIVWFIKVLLKHKGMEDKFKNLPCEERKNVIDRHSGQLDNISSLLRGIAGKVELLVKISTSMPSRQLLYTTSDFSEKRSPRKLNVNGDRLFLDIDGEAFLDENEAFFMDEIS